MENYNTPSGCQCQMKRAQFRLNIESFFVSVKPHPLYPPLLSKERGKSFFEGASPLQATCSTCHYEESRWNRDDEAIWEARGDRRKAGGYVTIPTKVGIQNWRIQLDSGFRRNGLVMTSYEIEQHPKCRPFVRPLCLMVI